MKKSSKIKLIVMSHPDDAELSCGGSVAKWTQRDDVYYIIVSSGEKGSWDKKESVFDIGKKREKEAIKATDYLGVKKVIFLKYSDGDVVEVKTLKLEIAALIRHIKPDTIVTHDPLWSRYFHPDHRATAHAAIEGAMIAREWHFYPFLIEIGLPPHRPGELLLTPTDRPTIINDITNTIDKKIESMKFHKSQVKQLPDWEQRIRDFAKIVGKKAGFEYGEGFYRMQL